MLGNALLLALGLAFLCYSWWCPRDIRVIGQWVARRGGDVAEWEAAPIVRYMRPFVLICGLVFVGFGLAGLISS
jgi:hypothetical protein